MLECCFACANFIELNDDRVICSGVCNRKYHRKCTNLSEKEFEVINGSKALFWNCELCRVLCNEHFGAQVNRIFDEKFGKFFAGQERKFEQLHNRLNAIEGKSYIEYPTNKSNENQQSSQHLLLNRKALIITGVITLLTILITALILANVLKSTPTQTFDGQLKFVNRTEWGALPHKDDMDKLKLPVHKVIISHTASDTCYDRTICISRVQVIQSFHMDSQKWDDIGYNFLIGGNGLVYIGRGWDNQGAHTKGYNRDSVGISFIGTFNTYKPTESQLGAAQLLIEEGVRLGKVASDYRLYGARQLGATESPGKALFQIIQTWPHWSANV